MPLEIVEQRPRILLGFVGEMGSGKSTCAKILQNQHPRVGIRSFAFPVKEELVRLLSNLARHVHRYESWDAYIETNKHAADIRNGLQFIGDRLGRGLFGEDLWVNYLEGSLYYEDEAEIIVDDVRYPNEVAMLKGRGFRIIYIHRDPIEREEYITTEAIKANPNLTNKQVIELVTTWQCHPSEAQIPALDIDEVVEYNKFEEWALETYRGKL